MNTDHSFYFTNNRFLAKAISHSGIKPVECRREYDEDYFARNGVSSRSEAEGIGKLGYEVWIFQQSPDLDRVIAAYDDENGAISALVESNADIPFCEAMIAEERCREFVRAIRGSKLLDKLVIQSRPYFRIKEPGKIQRKKNEQGETIVSVPGWKVIPCDASEQLRKEMGV